MRCPSQELLLIIGDLNIKVGETENKKHIASTAGKYGLGTINEREEMLLEFCA